MSLSPEQGARAASPGNTFVEVQCVATPLPYSNPTLVHQALCKRLGRTEVFLNETFSREDRSHQHASIGFGRLLTVVVAGNRAVLTGVPNILAAVRKGVFAAGFTLDSEDSFELPDPGDLWKLLEAIQHTFCIKRASGVPGFQFGFYGLLGYDVAHYIENLQRTIPRSANGLPEVVLSVFECVLHFNAAQQTAMAIQAHSALFDPSVDDLDEFIGTIQTQIELCSHQEAPPKPAQVIYTMDKASYVQRALKAKIHIAQGDIYQVQIGHEIRIQTPLTPEALYMRMRLLNPAPYMYFSAFGSHSLIGASPEVLVNIRDGKLTMRPLAGTVPRGANDAEDEAARSALSSDEKEIAEHIMLVDLCRNDVSRVCEVDTLEVPKLLTTERYSHVFHLVSIVTGQLRPGISHGDVVRAAFPAGTMTGAPKIRAMEIIEDLEETRRGAYAGAIGWMDFCGDANLALCIRSAVHVDDTYSIRASAGIVADSVPEKEWAETLAKMAGPYLAIAGMELRA